MQIKALSRLALLSIAGGCLSLLSCSDSSETASGGGGGTGNPLKIAYSDWPGWVAWEIAIKKGWFKEEGVEVSFEWMDYVESMEAYGAGKLDGVGMTNGDALVTGATAKPSVCILINDYSNGNDMLIAKPGINSVADLKGGIVGLEEGFVPHLLVLNGLQAVSERFPVGLPL